VSWPKPDLAEFHLKLIAAAAASLADPITIIDTQRRELLRRLRDALVMPRSLDSTEDQGAEMPAVVRDGRARCVRSAGQHRDPVVDSAQLRRDAGNTA
jgi:hypothetical protein